MPDKGRKRPFGLYAIIVLLFSNAILTALDSSRSYVALGINLGLPARPVPGIDAADVALVMRFSIAAGFLIVSIGLWTFRRAAWAALMIVVGLSLAEGILLYVHHEPRYLIMLLNVLIVFYLNQRGVQRLFRHSNTSTA